MKLMLRIATGLVTILPTATYANSANKANAINATATYDRAAAPLARLQQGGEAEEWLRATAGGSNQGCSERHALERDLLALFAEEGDTSASYKAAREARLLNLLAEHGYSYTQFQASLGQASQGAAGNEGVFAKLRRFTKREWLNLTLTNLLVGSPIGSILGARKVFNLVENTPVAIKMLSELIALPAGLINGAAVHFVSGDFSASAAAPVSEEFFFRRVLQEGLLRELPQDILTQLGYDSALADSAPAKVMRVLTSAFIFAIAHQNGPQGAVDCLPQLFGGLAFAGAMETTHKVSTAMFMHSLHNSVLGLISALVAGEAPPLTSTAMLSYYVATQAPHFYEKLARADALAGIPLVLPLEAFSELDKDTSYLACHYRDSDGSRYKAYAHYGDLPAALAPSSMAADPLDYLPLKGKWLDDGKRFAVLSDPRLLENICQRALEGKYITSLNVVNRPGEPAAITFSAGNTRLTDDSPLVMYRPLLKLPLDAAKAAWTEGEHPAEPGESLTSLDLMHLESQLHQDPIDLFPSKNLYYEDWNAVLASF